MLLRALGGLLAAGGCLALSSANAQMAERPSLQDSFRLGSGAGVLCRVQSNATGSAIKTIFDRAYAVVCRDAATPVGRLYALRDGAGDPLARLQPIRAEQAQCEAGKPGQVEDLGQVTVSDCRMRGGEDLDYRVYAVKRGRTTYVAEGLAGYDSALRLGLRTIVADRFVPGEIEVATTAVSNPTAFARVQAGSLDLDQALAEGYRRNNSGSYAEAAEFFDTLLERGNRDAAGSEQLLGEYVANRALQRSNMGEFAEADALFVELDKIPTADPVQLRLRRNFRALHLLNQRKTVEALTTLDRPVAPIARARAEAVAAAGEPVIDPGTAADINTRSAAARLGGGEVAVLTPEERAAILDAQARQLRGTALRLSGDLAGAERALNAANAELVAVREGRVTSITRLRAQTLSELSAVAEARGQQAEAERLLRAALVGLEMEYPGSAAAAAQKARLAAYLGRQRRIDDSFALYREVVAATSQNGTSSATVINQLAPYFALLAEQVPSRPQLVADFFAATETLVRPGVADTQAVLARELSGGSDEAARLFRQSVTLTRDIERARIEFARLNAVPEPSGDDLTRIAQLRDQLRDLEADQASTQAKLSNYPRYRALSTTALTLAELQEVLKPDEGYLKLAVVGPDVYAAYASRDYATAWKTAFKTPDLDKIVDLIRESIVKEENGQMLTYPFDMTAARALFVGLTGPNADRITSTKHLIFEPDGAMLRLPVNLLVTDDRSVAEYDRRAARPDDDGFDFTGVAWLGTRTEVSTAVSARAFRDTRRIAPSNARREYLGLGQNLPVSANTEVAATRSLSKVGAIDCNWPLTEWNKPIAATELVTAQRSIGGDGAEIVTEGAFSDTGLIGRQDLSQFRILHFATHGLVTAPRPECPAMPALLTSFGAGASDGLLTFREIYDLRLDADIVILSACDTAGRATIAATREAGVTTGGGSALDGLVRAFVGAGGRSVVASHWPTPDTFEATQRLISGLFEAPAGTPVAAALRQAQLKLMAAPETSHPYYWSAFAIVGDGAQPVLRPTRTAQR